MTGVDGRQGARLAKSTSKKSSDSGAVGANVQATRYHIDAIQRGLDVLWQFRAGRHQLTLAEISRTTGAVPSTTLRIVETLKDMGAIEELGDRGLYRPGPAVLRLGYNYIMTSELRTVAQPCLQRLSAAVKEPVTLAIKQDNEVFFIDCIGVDSPMSFHPQIGSVLPAHLSAAGRAVVAFGDDQDGATNRAGGPIDPQILAQARQLGYASQNGELAGGLRSIAAPITDEQGKAFAAIAIAVGASQYETNELTADIAPLLVGTAAEISARWRAQRAVAVRAEPSRIPPQAEPRPNSRYYVEALAKSFQVFECFSPSSAKLLLTEIAKATKINTSTVFRIASTLKAVGLLEEDTSGRYRLAPKVITLGYDALVTLDLKEFVEAPMLDLHRRTGESIYLSILAGAEAVDIASIRMPGLINTTGRSYPLYCTPGGKIWLAFMHKDTAAGILDTIQLVRRGPKTITDRATIEQDIAQIRSDRISEVYEEYLPGVAGAAAPIFDDTGRCVAALTISFSAAVREDPKRRVEVLANLKSTAADMSARLSWRFS